MMITNPKGNVNQVSSKPNSRFTKKLSKIVNVTMTIDYDMERMYHRMMKQGGKEEWMFEASSLTVNLKINFN